jgi:urease accessory protein
MEPDVLLSLMHFSDGLFPVGGYAHSFGLETYVADGLIRDANGVELFLRSYLQSSVAATDVAVALSSRRRALTGPSALPQCVEIDQMLDAMKSSSEQRSASRQMGRQTLRIATNLRLSEKTDELMFQFSQAAQRDETPGHHAVALGMIAASFAWDDQALACSFLYSAASSLVAASLRLLPLGQLAGQRILWELGPMIAALAAESRGKDMADVWSFAPALEIASMRHATLDARLFRS